MIRNYIPAPLDTMTQRIANLIRVHESGQIDDTVYSRELKRLQDEFLSQPQSSSVKILKPDTRHLTPQNYGS